MYIQNRPKTVNTLFPTHWMLVPYEDTLSSFPNGKSNKTILIIKDVAIYSSQSYLHHIVFPFPPDRSWWNPSKPCGVN